MAPFTQIVDSGEQRMGELLGGVGLVRYVGDGPGIGNERDDGGIRLRVRVFLVAHHDKFHYFGRSLGRFFRTFIIRINII